MYSFDETNGRAWQAALPLPILAGANRAAAVDPAFITFENLMTLDLVIGGYYVSGVCGGGIWDAGNGSWDDGDSMWLYGSDAQGARRLYRIDPEARTASAEDPAGLPLPSTTYDAQDLLVADGNRLWVARFSLGTALVSTRTPAGAQAHTLEGDVAAALELFEAVELGETHPRYNGFLPPEPLVALPWGDGRVLVARQFGVPKAVLLSLCEP